ncbi:hypothetical protein QOT17_005196 [Balamuthia mandrillaris]
MFCKTKPRSSSSSRRTPSSTHVSNAAGYSAQDLGMIASRNVTFTMRGGSDRHKIYLGDARVFEAEPQASFGLPSFALYSSKGKLLAYAKRCSRWYSSSSKWEVRLGGKHGVPIANITHAGTWWVKLMKDNETDRLRIDNPCACCTSIPIIKNGAAVAQIARKQRMGTSRFTLLVRKGEHVWVLLLLCSLVKRMMEDNL